MSTLIVKDGANEGQRYEVEGERTIGREGADITIDDSQMSRRHARLAERDGGLEIEDLGSTNGTWVNGNRIEGATRLSPGDTVRIGTTTFSLEGAEAPAMTVAAPVPQAPMPVVPDPAPTPASAPAAAPIAAARTSGISPHEPFGTYAAPVGKRSRGIASRQTGPILVTYALVLATAVALAIYFGLD